MKPKTIIKIVIDVFMTIGLLFAFGYQFWGEKWHEWIGAGMFVLFILHHILNAGWHKKLFKGEYTPPRILTLVIDIFLFADMIALMYSGIVLSRYVFAGLPIQGRMALARQLHILGSYWGIVLMSLHLGLHWNMILGMIRKISRKKCDSKVLQMILFLSGLGIAGYGVSVFMRRNFMDYLFLRVPFVFLDYGESILFFYIDILALMGTFVFISHYCARFLRRIKSGKGKKK